MEHGVAGVAVQEHLDDSNNIVILAATGVDDFAAKVLDQENALIKKTGIRPSFDKEVSYFAADGDKLVGILWAARNREKLIWTLRLTRNINPRKSGQR